MLIISCGQFNLIFERKKFPAKECLSLSTFPEESLYGCYAEFVNGNGRSKNSGFSHKINDNLFLVFLLRIFDKIISVCLRVRKIALTEIFAALFENVAKQPQKYT